MTLQNNKDNSVNKTDTQIVSTAVIIGLKDKVINIIDGLEKMQQKYGKNKRAQNAIKTMQKFVNCHLTCPTIMDKYNSVIQLMKEYAGNVTDNR